MVKQFTCISFDNLDFLIPSHYVVAGFYSDILGSVENISYNRETLPFLSLGKIVEQEFHCSSKGVTNVALIMRKHDFATDVRVNISNYTKTAFPYTGNFAISFGTEMSSVLCDISEFRLLGSSIRSEMQNVGVSAIRFMGDREQLLIAPDLLIRKFFAGAFL